MIKKALLFLFTIAILSCGQSEHITKIDGKWDLYIDKFIKSDLETTKIIPDNNLYFSGGSKKLSENDIYTSGSIRQQIDVVPGEIYALYLSGILSSCKIWVDGNLLGEYGTIGHSLSTSYPDIKSSLVNFTAIKEKADIVIEFSNFHFKTKYLFKWIVYGKSSKIVSQYLKNQSKDYITTGLLYICSILFLLIFIKDIRYRYNLYFALFTLSYGTRSFLMKNTTLGDYLPWFDWVLTFQLNKASELWALTFILLFLFSLYPREFDNKITKLIALVSFLTSFTAFIPLELFNGLNILLFMHIQVLISGLYIIFRLILSVIHGCYLSKWALTTLSLFFISIVFDIFANKIFLIYDYYSAQVVISVVIVMFFIIAKKRSDSSYFVIEKEKINSKLRGVFSKFVPTEILTRLGNNNLVDRSPGDFIVEVVVIVFIDIRNFTRLSESLTPKENFAMINQFYKVVGNHIGALGGYIESYGGDGVKVIFPTEPEVAIKATLNISDEVAETTGLKIGMSLHLGKVVLGTIGGGDRIQATAISDVTRIIGNMDLFNSKMGIEILITEKIYLLSSNPKESILTLGSIILKNEEEPLNLYQIIPKSYIIDPDFKLAFENAISAIGRKKYVKAFAYFQLAERYNPTHQLTKYYIINLEKFFKLRLLTFQLTI